jgi:hypothetical protein
VLDLAGVVEVDENASSSTGVDFLPDELDTLTGDAAGGTPVDARRWSFFTRSSFNCDPENPARTQLRGRQSLHYFSKHKSPASSESGYRLIIS